VTVTNPPGYKVTDSHCTCSVQQEICHTEESPSCEIATTLCQAKSLEDQSLQVVQSYLGEICLALLAFFFDDDDEAAHETRVIEPQG